MSFVGSTFGSGKTLTGKICSPHNHSMSVCLRDREDLHVALWEDQSLWCRMWNPVLPTLKRTQARTHKRTHTRNLSRLSECCESSWPVDDQMLQRSLRPGAAWPAAWTPASAVSVYPSPRVSPCLRTNTHLLNSEQEMLL